jgi:hypothetical protein
MPRSDQPRPAKATTRWAHLRVYVQVEDWDAPGYFVDIEQEVDLSAKVGQASPEQFAKAIGHEAKVAAITAARRLYDPKDSEYGHGRTQKR